MIFSNNEVIFVEMYRQTISATPRATRLPAILSFILFTGSTCSAGEHRQETIGGVKAAGSRELPLDIGETKRVHGWKHSSTILAYLVNPVKDKPCYDFS